jgi:hypothetical protein
MRVMQRDADLHAAVFEDEHVVDVIACAELHVAVAPDPHQRLGALGRERGERAFVFVCVHDDLGRAVRGLEGGEAIVEDRDLEGGDGDLCFVSRPPLSGARGAQRAVVAIRQEGALLPVDGVGDLLAAQLLEAKLTHACDP